MKVVILLIHSRSYGSVPEGLASTILICLSVVNTGRWAAKINRVILTYYLRVLILILKHYQIEKSADKAKSSARGRRKAAGLLPEDVRAAEG